MWLRKSAGPLSNFIVIVKMAQHLINGTIWGVDVLHKRILFN